MLLTFYFPIFDTRDFFPEREAKTCKPVWPNLYREQFVFQRNLGQVVARRRGGIRGWVAEADICEVRSSLKVPDVKPAFKRFFSDGWGGGYFSIGFDSWLFQDEAQAINLAALVDRLSAAEIRSKHYERPSTVIDAGKLVADLYSRGTTRGSGRALFEGVLHGTPIVIVEGDGSLIDKLFKRVPKKALPSRSDQPTSFAYTRVHSRLGGLGTPVFGLAGSNKPSAREALRTSRMVLARLYGELFVLERCLRLLNGDLCKMDQEGINSLVARVDMAANRLQGRRRPKLVAAPEDYASIVELFASTHEPGRVDELAPMLERLKLRPNLRFAILRAASPLYDEERKPSVTNYNFNAPVAGAIGDNASASNFSQYTLSTLATELGTMANSAKADTTVTAGQLALIEDAKAAATAGDDEKAKSALAKLGDWGVNFATSVGANVTGAIIRGQLSL